MTLADIKVACHDPTHPANAPVDESAPTPDMGRPWWVVVVNLRRQPPQPKFYMGHLSEKCAEQLCAVKQAEVDEQAKPFRYFVIERPEGGTL